MEKTNADKLVMMIGKLNKSRLEVAVYLGVSERTVCLLYTSDAADE